MATTNATVSLPAEVSSEIISNVQAGSAVMQLGRKITVNGRGEAIPVITGDPTAYFVDEGAVKTNSDPTVTIKTMKPRTIAIIEPFSNQFRDDNEALFAELVNRLPMLLAEKFDSEVFHGTAVTGFDTLANATAVSIATAGSAWDALVTAKSTIEAADGELNGWALSNQGITALLSEKDGSDRPLFVDSIAQGTVGTILGEGVVKAKKAYKDTTNDVLGFAGDWTKSVYGIVDDVQIAIADQATLTTTSGTINLFEQNMFAVRAEIRVGHILAMASQFAKLTA